MDPLDLDWTQHPGARPPDDWHVEEEYRPHYAAWRLDPSPANATRLLRATAPVLDTGVKAYGGGKDSPLIRSHAKRLALDAFDAYDPRRAALKTHLLHRLKGLHRYAARQSQPIAAPERVVLERGRLAAAEAELGDRLGREPSSQEVADATGLGLARQAHIRQYVPGLAEGQAAAARPDDEGGPTDPAVAAAPDVRGRLEFLYPDLDPVNQAIVEHGFGLHGRPKLRLGVLARRLNLSAGALSQRAGKIQAMLDELDDTGVLP